MQKFVSSPISKVRDMLFKNHTLSPRILTKKRNAIPPKLSNKVSSHIIVTLTHLDT